MKLSCLIGVLALGGSLASCGEKKLESPEADVQIPPPNRDGVKIETHLTRPETSLKIIQSGNRAIINWNEFSISDEEQIVTPGPDSEIIMKVPGRLSDYKSLPAVSGGGEVTFIDEAGNSVKAKPAPQP